MKKLTTILFISALLLLLASCGGPKADVNKMLNMYEEYTEIANEATKDKVLDDDEIEKLNKIMDDIEEFGKEMDAKYENNNEATKETEDLLSEEKNSGIVKNYTKALMALWDCEGAENLK